MYRLIGQDRLSAKFSETCLAMTKPALFESPIVSQTFGHVLDGLRSFGGISFYHEDGWDESAHHLYHYCYQWRLTIIDEFRHLCL